MLAGLSSDDEDSQQKPQPNKPSEEIKNPSSEKKIQIQQKNVQEPIKEAHKSEKKPIYNEPVQIKEKTHSKPSVKQGDDYDDLMDEEEQKGDIEIINCKLYFLFFLIFTYNYVKLFLL